MSSWEWPQYTYAALIALNLLCAANIHGRPKVGKHNFFWYATCSAVIVYILNAGGFFK